MIKTLRITSIVAAILAAIFLISLVLFGTGSNEQVEQFVNSESVVEKFNKSASSEAKRNSSETSPLVTQAKEFAKYLNPPPPKAPTPPVATNKPSVQPAPRPAISTAKFTLVGTSYYASQPERSLAFINEAGSGLRWVKQSSAVGHLIIEQVKDGLVVVRDGQRTFELSVPESPQRSLIEGALPAPSAVMNQPTPEPTATISIPAPTATISTPAPTAAISTPAPPVDEEMAEEFIRSLQAGVESNNIDTKGIEKIISDLESMRISASEAKKLKNLPEELTDVQQSTGRITADPNQTRIRKVERPRPARPRRPTRPVTR